MKATTTAAATQLTRVKLEKRVARCGRAAPRGTVSGRCNVLVMIEHHNACGRVDADPHLPTWGELRVVVCPHPDTGLAELHHVLGVGARENRVGDLTRPDVLPGPLRGVNPPAVGAARHEPGSVGGAVRSGVRDPYRTDRGSHLVGFAAGRGHRDQV